MYMNFDYYTVTNSLTFVDPRFLEPRAPTFAAKNIVKFFLL